MGIGYGFVLFFATAQKDHRQRFAKRDDKSAAKQLNEHHQATESRKINSVVKPEQIFISRYLLIKIFAVFRNSPLPPTSFRMLSSLFHIYVVRIPMALLWCAHVIATYGAFHKSTSFSRNWTVCLYVSVCASERPKRWVYWCAIVVYYLLNEYQNTLYCCPMPIYCANISFIVRNDICKNDGFALLHLFHARLHSSISLPHSPISWVSHGLSDVSSASVHAMSICLKLNFHLRLNLCTEYAQWYSSIEQRITISILCISLFLSLSLWARIR